jgi:DNA-binding CsgD family transcriptional regulator
MELIGRRAECSLLDGVLRAVRSGESRALVLHGDPGVGKSALMEYLARKATDCRLLRAAGVESEMELPYAALQQLCAPLLNRIDDLAAPQRDALSIAFGLSTGPAPNRLLIGLAVLSLLSDVADEQPLACLVDDLQWLDRASAQALAFVARRLGAESVALILATRVPYPDLSDLPAMQITGLRAADARALLDAVLSGPLDERVRDQFVAETGGNPLALLELPRGLSVHHLAGGFGLPGAEPLSAAVEQSFRRDVQALPDRTRRLLLLAAAEPLGDPLLLWRAAAQWGIRSEASAPAAAAGLAEFDVRVRFRHPLARSAVYGSAPVRDRRLAHQALAEATDPDRDPDRRAWHRAQASEGPDEDVAAELESSAGRARARGGLAAAAAFLQWATMLTVEPGLRVERALAAASANLDAGAFGAAVDMLAVAEGGPLSDHQGARANLIRAQLAYVTGRGNDAPPLLLKAAKRLAPIDPALSRATYLEALTSAMFADRLAVGVDVVEVARAAAMAPPPPDAPTPPDLLLEGIAARYNDGYAAGVPLVRQALDRFGSSMPADEQLRWSWLACTTAVAVLDDDRWATLSDRHVQLARGVGALSEVPLALSSRVLLLCFVGDLSAAALLLQEQQAVIEATGASLAPVGAMALAAFRGDEAGAAALIEMTNTDVMRRGEGVGLTIALWANALLNNGRGNYQKARTEAQRCVDYANGFGSSPWGQVELVEAAVRSGSMQTATSTLSRLTEMATVCGTDWALGVEARSRALLSDGADAERLYRDAIERLGRTRVRTELARAHLVYGEWLRRERRRTDARTQLRIAHDLFDGVGMHAFAERTRRELLATGETARKRTAAATGPQLTPQEQQIARLAAQGLTNPDIGARLFISSRTVQYHLSKVFTKLGIRSRSQLRQMLPT